MSQVIRQLEIKPVDRGGRFVCWDRSSGRGGGVLAVVVDDGVDLGAVDGFFFLEEVDEAVEGVAVGGEEIGGPLFSLAQ